MSKFHCWYVSGRTLCVAVAFAIFATLQFAVPTLATEVTGKVAQKTAISNGQVKAVTIAETVSPPGEVERKDIAETDAPKTGELSEEGSFAPAIASAVGEVSSLPQATAEGEIYELILNVSRKGRPLSEATIGLEKDFIYYVPLREVARVLKFPTEANLQAQTASGFFFNPENTYSLDLKQGTYTVKDDTANLPENSAFIRDLGQNLGDIYVTTELLNKLWNLDIELNFGEQSIEIKTKRRLPFELERERKKNQERLAEREDGGKEDTRDIQYVPNGYKWLGPQTLTITDTLAWDNELKEVANTFTVTGRGDALGTSADYTINTRQSKEGPLDVKDLRLRLTRRDYGSDELLPFGLKLAQAGDIAAKPSPLIDRILSGRGVYVSSEGNARKQSFDDVVIDGTTQPGWEVELYLNRQLIDFGFANELGEYIFENVPLNYGKNRVKLVLYGPQGQIEERHEEYNVRNNMLKPGETNFEASALDFRERLIKVENKPNNTEGTAKYLRVNRGINNWATGFATATQSPGKDGSEKYVTLGANFNALEGTGQVEAYKQVGGGTVFDARYATKFAGFRTTFRTSFFNDFESRDAGFDDGLKTFEGEFRTARNVNLPFGQLGLHLTARHTKHEGNQKDTFIQSRQSLSREKLFLTNTLNTNYSDGDHRSSKGQFNINTPLSDNWDLRSTLFYDIHPDKELDKTRIKFDYNDNDKFSSTLTFNQGIKDKDKTSIGTSASYDFGTFLGSADIDWTKGDGLDLILRANTILGPRGEEGLYKYTSSFKGQGTALEARLYHDIDKDGEYGEADQPLEGGRIRINGGRRSDPSNAEGMINMPNAGTHGLAFITFDQEHSPDPFLVSARDAYKTVLRPGTKPFINMPLVMTGSIDGTIRFADGRPVPGMIIQLIDQYGQLVAESPTLSDGFYVFEFVKPGRYIVQVHPSHRVFVPTRTVTVASDDLFAYGVDLQILEQAKEAPVTNNEGDGRVAHTYLPSVTGGTEKPVSMPSSDGVQAVVRAVRLGEHPHKVRLVLDLSEPTSYRITKEPNGSVIYVELPDASWDAVHPPHPNKHGIFSSCDIQPLPGGGTQIRLEGRQKIDVFYNALLLPEKGRGHRIYIDFMRVK